MRGHKRIVTEAEHALLQPRVLVPFAAITLIWGSTWLVITGQLGDVPPAWSITYRFIIAAAAMFAYAKAIGAPLRLDRQGHRFAIAFGLPQFCLNFNCVYLAERHVTSGLVAMIFGLLLVPNSLLAWLFLRQRISARFLAGSLIAVVGVTLLFVQELRANPVGVDAVALGIGLTLIGVLSASAANVIQAMDRIRVHSLPTMIAWGMTYGVLGNLAIASLFYGPPRFETRFVYWGGLLYLGLVASALAFSLYFRVIRVIGPGRAAYSSLVIPIIAMLLSTLFEGYRWTGAAVAGSLLALVGLFIALRAGRAAPTTS